jgi:hypothetical protein
VAGTAAVGAFAADQGINPRFENFALSVESPPPVPVVFWERFDFAFASDVNAVFADALQPLNTVRWNMELRGKDFSESFLNRSASRARSAFAESVEYSTREAAIETPFIWWLEDRQGWFANLLRGSIGSVAEESVGTLNISYHAVEQSWWRRLSENGGTYYGIRPFSTSPYVYMGQTITDGEKAILMANVRYYYDRFADHRFELALSVPLAYGLTLDLGSSYQFGTHTQQRFVMRFLKEFKRGGIANLGFDVQQRPMLIAGISVRW